MHTSPGRTRKEIVHGYESPIPPTVIATSVARFQQVDLRSFPAPRTTGARPLKIVSMVTARDVADGQTAEFDSRASW